MHANALERASSGGARRGALTLWSIELWMPELRKTLILRALNPGDKLGIFINDQGIIRKADAGSVGDNAGFVAGDRILSINGTLIEASMDKIAIAGLLRGSPAAVSPPKSIVVTRQVSEAEAKAAAGAKSAAAASAGEDDEEDDEPTPRLFRLTLPSLPADAKLGLALAKDNVVRSVAPGSYAEAAGLKDGDAIVSVDGQEMAGVDKLTCAKTIRGNAAAATRALPLVVRRHTNDADEADDPTEGERFSAEVRAVHLSARGHATSHAMRHATSHAMRHESCALECAWPCHVPCHAP